MMATSATIPAATNGDTRYSHHDPSHKEGYHSHDSSYTSFHGRSALRNNDGHASDSSSYNSNNVGHRSYHACYAAKIPTPATMTAAQANITATPSTTPAAIASVPAATPTTATAEGYPDDFASKPSSKDRGNGVYDSDNDGSALLQFQQPQPQ
jgi:hypothetical protein